MTVLFVAFSVLSAAYWPQWRGPGARGVSSESGFPLAWSPTTNLVWKTEIPGRGHSSPIIWGDRIFLTTSLEGPLVPGARPIAHIGWDGEDGYVHPDSIGGDRLYTLQVLALDRESGKILWTRTAYEGTAYDARHRKNSYASSTPVTDGRRVYAFFESEGVYAYDFDGNLVWKASVGGIGKGGMGPGMSPVLYEDFIILQCDQELGEGSFIVALDTETGREVWRKARAHRRSWATPLLLENGGRTELIASGAESVVVYDPRTGDEIWRSRGTESHPIPSAVYGHDMVFLTAGSQAKRAMGVRLDTREIVWTYNKGTAYVPSPILYGDYLYLMTDKGILTCLDARTGEVKYEGGRVPVPATFTASPVAFEGKILLTSEDGDTYVIKSGPVHQVLRTNSVGEPVYASPALALGKIYIRGEKHLFAFASAPVDLPSIEKALEAELEETRTPGAALVVVRGDEVLLSKGFGLANAETGEPVTPDHLFRVGSTTKLFTAMALATLAGQGKVDLARPVGSAVPGLPDFAAALTADQLLSHTAGIKDQPADYGLHDESALAAFPRGWGEDYRLSPPGRAFSYSNPGFALAGLLVEETTGKPYADAVKELLLAPLGMERATFRPTEAMTHRFSQGHKISPEGRAEVVRPFSDDSRQWPNGFLMVSASEMGRFVRAFLNDGRLSGRDVLSPGAISRVSTPHAEIPYDLPDMKKPKYGYGLFLHTWDGVRIAEHVGTMPGYTSILKMAPDERFAVILLANQEGVMFEKTLSAAFASFRKEASPPPSETNPVAMTESEMEALVGVYRNRWPVKIQHEEGALFLEQFGGRLSVEKLGPDLYSAQAPGGRPPIPFRILAGSDGKGELLQMFLWIFNKEKAVP